VFGCVVLERGLAVFRGKVGKPLQLRRRTLAADVGQSAGSAQVAAKYAMKSGALLKKLSVLKS